MLQVAELSVQGWGSVAWLCCANPAPQGTSCAQRPTQAPGSFPRGKKEPPPHHMHPEPATLHSGWEILVPLDMHLNGSPVPQRLLSAPQGLC